MIFKGYKIIIWCWFDIFNFYSLFNFIKLIRELRFPDDSTKNAELNSFIKLLLNKKVNQRVCSFSKLKTTNFLADFNWEDLLDFKIKPPYIPECKDFVNNLSSHSNLYEEVLKVIIYINSKLNFLIKLTHLSIFFRMKRPMENA